MYKELIEFYNENIIFKINEYFCKKYNIIQIIDNKRTIFNYFLFKYLKNNNINIKNLHSNEDFDFDEYISNQLNKIEIYERFNIYNELYDESNHKKNKTIALTLLIELLLTKINTIIELFNIKQNFISFYNEINNFNIDKLNMENNNLTILNEYVVDYYSMYDNLSYYQSMYAIEHFNESVVLEKVFSYKYQNFTIDLTNKILNSFDKMFEIEFENYCNNILLNEKENIQKKVFEFIKYIFNNNININDKELIIKNIQEFILKENF